MKKETCPYCNGVGEVAHGRQCPVCGGSGEVKSENQKTIIWKKK